MFVGGNMKKKSSPGRKKNIFFVWNCHQGLSAFFKDVAAIAWIAKLFIYYDEYA
jgi:hypothetical protein